jgi:GDP-L-fucose synthase
MKILVTGGSGMVGRSLQDIIPDAKYLSSKDCDLTNPIETELLIKTYKPDIIIHLAAKVGGIIDNINKPAEYFDDNVIMNTNLVKCAHKYGVKRFIGILSTCIYPNEVATYPMGEEMLHEGPPTPTNFSYGYAKRCLAVQIDSYNQQYGTEYQYLTPCNLYGEYDKWGENSHFVAALIKKIIIADRNGEENVGLFGTGKPLRQFMHSSDLARIIKHCIDNDITESFNVATKENLSIKEIAEIALKAIEPKNVKGFTFDSTKPDGQYRKDVSIDKMEHIIPGFQFTPLIEGIRETHQIVTSRNII